MVIMGHSLMGQLPFSKVKITLAVFLGILLA